MVEFLLFLLLEVRIFGLFSWHFSVSGKDACEKPTTTTVVTTATTSIESSPTHTFSAQNTSQMETMTTTPADSFQYSAGAVGLGLLPTLVAPACVALAVSITF